MRINVSIAAAVICGIAFTTRGGAFHGEFGASLAGRFRHKLLRKTVRGTLLVAGDGRGVWFCDVSRAVGMRRYSQLGTFPQRARTEGYQDRLWQELVRHP